MPQDPPSKSVNLTDISLSALTLLVADLSPEQLERVCQAVAMGQRLAEAHAAIETIMEYLA